MKNTVFEKAKQLVNQEISTPIGKGTGYYLLEAENLLLKYLTDYPNDIEGWLLLLRIEINPPLRDHEKIIEYSKQILLYDPLNPYALLFWSYADYYLKANDDEKLYHELLRFKNDNHEIMSMIEVAKALFFENIDREKYRESLEKSIEYSKHQQLNFSMLAQYYLDMNNYDQALSLYRHGIKNVKFVDAPYNPTSIEGFFNEIYKGVDISQRSYDELTDIITKLETHSKMSL